MTAASAPIRTSPNRSGVWTFLRLLGGWATVAVLAYLLGVPSDSFGWAKMVFTWVLLTLIADEFAGWFGYMGMALGILPFLHGTPEQWFTVFPLIFAALFALLLLKHSGGPFVVPFAALLFMGTIIGAEKLGIKMKIPLALIGSSQFRNATFMPMLAVMGFSFLRQLGFMLWRWQLSRKANVSSGPKQKPTKAVPQPSPAPAAPILQSGPVTQTIVVSPPAPAANVVVPPAPGTAPQVPAPSVPAVIDLDLNDSPETAPPKKG